MPATDTDVCNMALAELGDELIASLTDGATVSSRLALFFPTARDLVLTMAEWNFAKVMATLTAMPLAPAFKWQYQFTLPANPPCLDILTTSLGHGGLYERGYHPEYGEIVYANETPLSIEYIGSLEVALWKDPVAIEVLAKVLASQLAKSLTGQTALAKEKLEEAQALIPLGMARNQKEGRAAGQFAPQSATMEALNVMNQALSAVGTPSVRDFSDDTRAAHEVRVHYATALDATLELHPWNFATFRSTLTPVTNAGDDVAPLCDWAYQYLLPDGHRDRANPWCLSVLGTDQGNGAHFAVGADVAWGRVLYSNEASVRISYIGRVTDLSRWSGLALQVFGLVLASQIAPALSPVKGLAGQLFERAFALLPVAQRHDARQGSPPQLRPNTTLTVARGTRGVPLPWLRSF